MRNAILLSASLLAALFAACGGDDYSSTPEPTAGQPAAAPDAPPAPPKPPPVKLSAEAEKMQMEYKLLDKILDYEAKRDGALKKAEEFAAQTLPADALYFRGLMFQIGEDRKRAADDFVAYVAGGDKNDPNYKWGLYRAVETLCASGRAADAGQYVDKFATMFSSEAKYLKAMAAMVGSGLLGEGKFDAAVPMLGRAVNLDHDFAGVDLVGALQVLGRFDEAKAKAAELAAKYKGHTEQERYQVLAQRAERVGRAAPAFNVAGWSDDLDTEELKGKVVLVYYWGLKYLKFGQVKALEKLLRPLHEKYSSEGLEICGLSEPIQKDLTNEEAGPKPDMTPEEEVQQLKIWVENQEPPTPWHLGLLVSEEAKKSWVFYKLPSFVLIDRKGNYRYFRSGGEAESIAILAKAIEKLLDEK